MSKRPKSITGRPPLYVQEVQNPTGLWGANGNSYNLIPVEDVGKASPTHPFRHLLNNCYFCGRQGKSPTRFTRRDKGTKWEIMEANKLSEEDLDFLEDLGLYQSDTLYSGGTVDLLIAGYGIKFREKTWVFFLCPECQQLLSLPDLTNMEKETEVYSTIYMTGRALKTGNEKKKGCYFCGRLEGSDSVCLQARPDGRYELIKSELFLSEKIRAVGSEGQHIYNLCPECEVLLELSPRIIMTDDGLVNGDSLYDLMDNYTDINNALHDKDFVKKATVLCNSIGTEEFLKQLISHLPKTKS
jgi:hypothetical protein